MKDKPDTIKALTGIGAVAAPPSDHDDVTASENERAVFIEACRQHEFHTIENLSHSNGRWHATAVKSNHRFHVDYDAKSKSFIQGKQIV